MIVFDGKMGMRKFRSAAPPSGKVACAVFSSWYLSGANLTPCRFAHAMHLSCAWFSLVQFSATVSPYIIRFVSSINPRATIS